MYAKIFRGIVLALLNVAISDIAYHHHIVAMLFEISFKSISMSARHEQHTAAAHAQIRSQAISSVFGCFRIGLFSSRLHFLI